MSKTFKAFIIIMFAVIFIIIGSVIFVIAQKNSWNRFQNHFAAGISFAEITDCAHASSSDGEVKVSVDNMELIFKHIRISDPKFPIKHVSGSEQITIDMSEGGTVVFTKMGENGVHVFFDTGELSYGFILNDTAKFDFLLKAVSAKGTTYYENSPWTEE